MTTPALELLSTDEVQILGSSRHANRRVVVHVAGSSGAFPRLLRRLRRLGCSVRTSHCPSELLQLCTDGSPDLVILPFGIGIARSGELLAWLSAHQPTVPVLLLGTALTARQVAYALEQGVVGVLDSGADVDRFTGLIDRSWRERELRLLARRVEEEAEVQRQRARKHGALLDRALAELYLAWQPLLELGSGLRSAREALVRCPSLARHSALPLLQLARRLDRGEEVDRLVQQRVARALTTHPRWDEVFVNLESTTLDEEGLVDPACPLLPLAGRVVLDLPPRNSRQEPGPLLKRVSALRQAGYRIASTDLVLDVAIAGEDLSLRPEFVKLAVDELRQAERSRARWQYLHFVLSAAHQQGARIVVVGVESERDLDLAAGVGADLVQGFHIARPRRVAPEGALLPKKDSP